MNGLRSCTLHGNDYSFWGLRSVLYTSDSRAQDDHGRDATASPNTLHHNRDSLPVSQHFSFCLYRFFSYRFLYGLLRNLMKGHPGRGTWSLQVDIPLLRKRVGRRNIEGRVHSFLRIGRSHKSECTLVRGNHEAFWHGGHNSNTRRVSFPIGGLFSV